MQVFQNQFRSRCPSLIWSAAARYSATAAFTPVDSITCQSGVAEYLAAALQIKTVPNFVLIRYAPVSKALPRAAQGSSRVSFLRTTGRQMPRSLPDYRNGDCSQQHKAEGYGINRGNICRSRRHCLCGRHKLARAQGVFLCLESRSKASARAGGRRRANGIDRRRWQAPWPCDSVTRGNETRGVAGQRPAPTQVRR